MLIKIDVQVSHAVEGPVTALQRPFYVFAEEFLTHVRRIANDGVKSSLGSALGRSRLHTLGKPISQWKEAFPRSNNSRFVDQSVRDHAAAIINAYCREPPPSSFLSSNSEYCLTSSGGATRLLPVAIAVGEPNAPSSTT